MQIKHPDNAKLGLGALVAMAVLCIDACTRPVLPPAPVTQPDIYTTQYVRLDGADTIFVETVTKCLSRLIGDVDSRKPAAFVHYDIDAEVSGFPRQLTFAFWASRDSVNLPPRQVARTKVRGDSVLTEVWRGAEHQIQSARAPSGAFVWTTGYVGLLAQLLEALHARGDRSSLLLFFIATRGHTATASVKRVTPDSIFVAIDSAQLAARWSPSAGLIGVGYTGTALRIERAPVASQSPANDRCGQPPLFQDSL